MPEGRDAGHLGRVQRGSAVEQLIRNQQVAGLIPAVGSIPTPSSVRNLPPVLRPCRRCVLPLSPLPQQSRKLRPVERLSRFAVRQAAEVARIAHRIEAELEKSVPSQAEETQL